MKAAYDQGCEDTRRAILAAATAPITETLRVGDTVEAEVIPAPTTPPKPPTTGKAPRGTVPRVLKRMLTDHPGKTIVEYEAMIADYDSRIAAKSIGNELRRMEGIRYRRNTDGQWFLIVGNEEAAGTANNETPAASDRTNQGQIEWNRLS